MEAKTFALVACNPVGSRYGLDCVRLGLMSVVWRTEEVYRIQKVLPIEIVGKEGEILSRSAEICCCSPRKQLAFPWVVRCDDLDALSP